MYFKQVLKINVLSRRNYGNHAPRANLLGFFEGTAIPDPPVRHNSSYSVNGLFGQGAGRIEVPGENSDSSPVSIVLFAICGLPLFISLAYLGFIYFTRNRKQQADLGKAKFQKTTDPRPLIFPSLCAIRNDTQCPGPLHLFRGQTLSEADFYLQIPRRASWSSLSIISCPPPPYDPSPSSNTVYHPGVYGSSYESIPAPDSGPHLTKISANGVNCEGGTLDSGQQLVQSSTEEVHGVGRALPAPYTPPI